MFKVKWRDYQGIIAQRTPYKSHNAKRAWFVLVFDVIMQWIYCLRITLVNCLPDKISQKSVRRKRLTIRPPEGISHQSDKLYQSRVTMPINNSIPVLL